MAREKKNEVFKKSKFISTMEDKALGSNSSNMHTVFPVFIGLLKYMGPFY